MGSRPGATKHRAALHRRVRRLGLGAVIANIITVISDVKALESPFGNYVHDFIRDGLPYVRHCGDLLTEGNMVKKRVVKGKTTFFK